MNKIIALIPARGGSKRIPRKNIKLLNGKPLISYVINSLSSSNVDEVWVSTDDDEIAVISERLGANVLKRPLNLATDEIKTESVMKHFSDKISCDAIMLCEATQPTLTSEDINISLKKYSDGDYDSLALFSGQSFSCWTIENEIPKSHFDLKNRLRSQDMKQIYSECGLWITKRDAFEKSGCRLSGKIGYHIVSHPVIDIDNEIDFKIAELLLKKCF